MNKKICNTNPRPTTIQTAYTLYKSPASEGGGAAAAADLEWGQAGRHQFKHTSKQPQNKAVSLKEGPPIGVLHNLEMDIAKTFSSCRVGVVMWMGSRNLVSMCSCK